MNSVTKTAKQISEAVNLQLTTDDGWEVIGNCNGIRNPDGVHSDVWNEAECVAFNNAILSGLMERFLAKVSDIVKRYNIRENLQFMYDRIQEIVNSREEF